MTDQPVPDMTQALAAYVQRWQSIPAEQRRAIVAEQATIREERARGRAA